MQLLEQENTRYRSKSLQLENTEQNHRIQYENLKRKVQSIFKSIICWSASKSQGFKNEELK